MRSTSRNMEDPRNRALVAGSKDRPTKATSPFDRGDADLILRTSDHVDFLVHRQLLVIASPFFECMLSLPQAPSDQADRPPDKVVIDISEDSRTMDIFLRFLYPVMDAEIMEISLLPSVLDAAVKYDTAVVLAAMKRTMILPRFLETQALAVFVISCRHGLEDEAKAAAQQLVNSDSSLQNHDDPILDDLTAGQYYRLLQFKREQPTLFTSFNFCSPPPNPTRPPLPGTTRIGVTAPFSGSQGDLVILMSSDSHAFFVHRVVIKLASPTMLDGILALDTTHTAAVPVYPMQEDIVCVDLLLRFCYPIAKPDFPSFDAYRAVLVAARKYRLWGVEKVARSLWLTFAGSSVLSRYFLAVELGWKKEAVACARTLVVQRPVEVEKDIPVGSGRELSSAYSSWIPTMESTCSTPYRNLLSFVDNCYKAVAISSTYNISALPTRVHSTSNHLSIGRRCRDCYPTQFSTDAPPDWIQGQLAEIKRALMRHPSSDVLALDTPLASSFIAFVTEEGPNSCCSTSTNIQWAVKVLQKYAEAVNQAIRKVELKMVVEEEH
ncbi:hypothetical protein V8D89_016026 [Ganoderma adspersum]